MISFAHFLFLIFIIAAMSHNVLLIYWFAFIQAAIGTFFDPARGALVQVIVPEEQYMEANSISQTIVVIRTIRWCDAGRFASRFYRTLCACIYLDALTFFASVGLVWFVHSEKARIVHAEGPKHFIHSLQEGLKTVTHNSVLLAIIITMTMMMFAVSPLQVLMVPFLTNILHVSVKWYGVVQGGDTIGNIIAAVIMVGIASRINPKLLVYDKCFHTWWCNCRNGYGV